MEGWDDDGVDSEDEIDVDNLPDEDYLRVARVEQRIDNVHARMGDAPSLLGLLPSLPSSQSWPNDSSSKACRRPPPLFDSKK